MNQSMAQRVVAANAMVDAFINEHIAGVTRDVRSINLLPVDQQAKAAKKALRAIADIEKLMEMNHKESRLLAALREELNR